MERVRPAVEDYMTESPYSVAANEGLTTARDLMKRHGVRHLSVTRDGQLVGVLSERDLAAARDVADDWKALIVADVMTAKPYVVRPDAPLNQVARAMAQGKYGTAVVVDGSDAIGIFTLVDALTALADTLEGRHERASLEGIARRPRRGRTRPVARQPR